MAQASPQGGAVPDSLLQQTNLAGRTVDVLRLDRLNALAPGNKWFKLRENLHAAHARGAKTLASFGGPWSNHLHALAACAQEAGFASVGWVRGEPDRSMTAMLADAKAWGMQIRFLSRGDYRRRHDPQFVQALAADLETPYLLPEGGANRLAALGCGGILHSLPDGGCRYDVILLACGTGTTLAGLAGAYRGKARLIGIPVLRAETFMAADIAQLLAAQGTGQGRDAAHWQLDFRHHWGSYGKVPGALAEFIRTFEADSGIPLDPIYTAKLFYAARTLIETGEVAAHEKVLLVHSGGLQGRRGFPELFGDKF